MQAQMGKVDILIVDNDERIVELVAWFLRKRGYGVRTCPSFQEAQQELATRPPHLMLSDIDLGQTSAREELPRLMQEGLLPPTLIVSGYLDGAISEELLALPPVLDTLAKPFDFSLLEERIQDCLARIGPLQPAAAESSNDMESSTPAQEHPGPVTPAESEDEDEGWIEITASHSPGRHGMRLVEQPEPPEHV